MTLYRQVRQLLFRLDAERAHTLTLRALAFAGATRLGRGLLKSFFASDRPGLAVRVMGLDFPNPVGLAAGYDKDGVALHGLACLGFGHLEVGTVTPESQSGNPRPRLFRLEEDRALINRLGFPGGGGDALLARLTRQRPAGVILGVNIGKGVNTPPEAAAEDYVHLLKQFHDHADYLAVNVSSPNTVGLRRLQARRLLEDLLGALVETRRELQAGSDRRVPLVVKLAPDLSADELEDALAAITLAGLDGVIVANTTLARPNLSSKRAGEAGGLSGAPLREISTQMVVRVHRLAGGALPIIAVGGIFSPDDAQEKLDAGAALIQLYTGLVYVGPDLPRHILKALSQAA